MLLKVFTSPASVLPNTADSVHNFRNMGRLKKMVVASGKSQEVQDREAMDRLQAENVQVKQQMQDLHKKLLLQSKEMAAPITATVRGKRLPARLIGMEMEGSLPKRAKKMLKKTVPAAVEQASDGDSSELEQEVAGSTQVITQAIKELVGFQDLDSSGIEQGEALSSFSILGATLDNKLKTKIWSQEYVDLGTLVPNTALAAGLNVQYDVGSVSQISLSSAKVRQPGNVMEWHRWFSIYASVYTQKYADEAPALFT